jgi:tetratricopeptide (TPR) repeat protein
MSQLHRPCIFLSSIFHPGVDQPIRAACPGLIWDPRDIKAREPDRSIEDICRDLIRRSSLFVGVFDARGGRALFDKDSGPVTVLEIELIQALFQRMPLILFTLPGFESNRRLRGLVALAQNYRLARVITLSSKAIASHDNQTRLSSWAVARIARAIRDSAPQHAMRMVERITSRFITYRNLEVRLLADGLDEFKDPFDENQARRLIEKAAGLGDHAARLSFLWPALRQLASVPYSDPRYQAYQVLWVRLVGIWDRSAAWYGLHNDSPIGRLAATNTRIWIADHSPAEAQTAPFMRGARASAFLSMAHRLWLPWHRRRLIQRSLEELETALRAGPDNPAGFLAIRGSIHLASWRIAAAIADYETVVALRSQNDSTPSGLGEALVELGWAYVWAFRRAEAKHAFAKGVDLMRQGLANDPSRIEFFIRGLMKQALGLTLLFDFATARRAASEGCRLARARVALDQISGVRSFLCKLLASDT